jgi:hypothetical protein
VRLETIDEMDCPHPGELCPSQFTRDLGTDCRACKKAARQEYLSETMVNLRERIKASRKVKEDANG